MKFKIPNMKKRCLPTLMRKLSNMGIWTVSRSYSSYRSWIFVRFRTIGVSKEITSGNGWGPGEDPQQGRVFNSRRTSLGCIDKKYIFTLVPKDKN